MEKSQEQFLLEEAAMEIRILRNKTLIQSARLEMFDDVMSLLKTQISQPGMSMQPDIVHQIEKHIRQMQNPTIPTPPQS